MLHRELTERKTSQCLDLSWDASRVSSVEKFITMEMREKYKDITWISGCFLPWCSEDTVNFTQPSYIWCHLGELQGKGDGNLEDWLFLSKKAKHYLKGLFKLQWTKITRLVLGVPFLVHEEDQNCFRMKKHLFSLYIWEVWKNLQH